MSFNLSSRVAAEDATTAGGVSASDMDIMPPIYYEETTERVELKDAAGKVIGYDDITSGFGYTYTTHYDADLAYIGSDYVDDSGYRSSTTQTTLKDASGNITGYRVDSSGGNAEYSYESSDEYDSDWQLLHSEYSDSNGYTSETTQTTSSDASGNITGYSIISSGGDASSHYSSSSSYDGDWNLLSSSYSDSSGYTSSYVQTTLTDSAGKVTGYEVVSSGSGGWIGEYTSTERLDADRRLISSEYSDSSGYHSTYELETEHDASGKITGYVAISTWTYGGETYTTENRYDADWTWIDGTDPPVVIDDGPKILPVLSTTTDDQAEAMRSAAGAQSGSSANHVADTAGTADTLTGTDDDDIFIVSDRDDVIAGRGGKGDDAVISSAISLHLGRGNLAGIENAGLTGSADLDLTGDGRANNLSGNAGDNHLNGRKGADTLFGGMGSDTFMLDKFSLKQADTVVDFSAGTDTIGLSRKTFGDAVWGDNLRYDADSGALIYESDGKAVTIALIGDADGLSGESFSFY